ncbi:MAG: transcriptional regulator [Syntrophomonadaceae bacterium]|nr:transcriptional regulator [Syntrophomonadaceae bacterium]
MTFAEKLDLLMNITNTSNSLLARKISIDASFISRLRRGVRIPAKNVSYIQAMSEYFAHCCQAEYQKAALWEAIKNSSPIQPQPSLTTADLILQWLRQPQEAAIHSIDNLLNGMIHHFQFSKIEAAATSAAVDGAYGQAAAEVEMFYGLEGRQTAALKFLSLVVQNKKPQTLLLYSDEDMNWMINPEFTAKWAALMVRVLQNGNRIKMIHTINRNLDEMLDGIKRWVPLYMTGNIEPYYYSKTRDGLFRRTLFIAPETAAVTSSSVRSETLGVANLLFTKKEAIRALVAEFHDFLDLCRPLMRIFNSFNQQNYLGTLIEFEEEAGHTIISSDGLTNITMPPEVVASILERLDDPDRRQLLALQHHRIRNFYDRLPTNPHAEIFSLPRPETILAGQVRVNFWDIPHQIQVFYTPEEYYQHLHNVIRLLKTYDNYHVYLTADKHLEGSMVCVKEDVGVLVGKTSPPSVIFAIRESNMTAAFWDYMNILVRKESHGKKARERTIAELESFVARFENSK